MITALRNFTAGSLIGTCLFTIGCSTVPKEPYRFGRDIEGPDTLLLEEGEPQVTRGRPRKVLDVAGNIWSFPSKLLLWNWKIDRHSISPETEEILLRYLHDNRLRNVKVRLNDYDVPGEWRRLKNNSAVGAGWRWTFGLIVNVIYTILPGRFFGGDNYNPYTNTINLYSDHPAMALHEGGHAKDFAQRTHKGTYAFTYHLPLTALLAEARATGDAIGYLRTNQDILTEKNGYKVLYPAYSMYIGAESFRMISWFIPLDKAAYYAISFGPVIPAHIVGRVKAWQEGKKVKKEEK